MSSWCFSLCKQIKNHTRSFRKTVNFSDTASTCRRSLCQPSKLQGYLPLMENFQIAKNLIIKALKLVPSLRIHQIPGSGRLWNSDKVALIGSNSKFLFRCCYSALEDAFLEKSPDGQEKLQLRSKPCSSCHGDGKRAFCKSSITESPRMKTERKDNFPLPDLVKSSFEVEALWAFLQYSKFGVMWRVLLFWCQDVSCHCLSWECSIFVNSPRCWQLYCLKRAFQEVFLLLFFSSPPSKLFRVWFSDWH